MLYHLLGGDSGVHLTSFSLLALSSYHHLQRTSVSSTSCFPFFLFFFLPFPCILFRDRDYYSAMVPSSVLLIVFLLFSVPVSSVPTSSVGGR